VSPSFPPFLAAYDEQELRRHPSSLVALDAKLQIAWTNTAWGRFALENDGEATLERFAPGVSYLDGISGPLREYFARVFAHVLVATEPFELEYECSSPETLRAFRMRALPLKGAGILVDHSPRIFTGSAPTETDAVLSRYTHPTGLVLQCSNCRRVLRADRASWDWVPAFVKTPAKGTSHGLCSPCSGYYWP
jgi:hypothetical protein